MTQNWPIDKNPDGRVPNNGRSPKKISYVPLVIHNLTVYYLCRLRRKIQTATATAKG